MVKASRIKSDNDSAKVLKLSRFETPLFEAIWIAFSDVGVTNLYFEEPTDIAAFEAVPLPAAWMGMFESYFRGEPESFDALPLDLQGTDFQLRVWGSLRRIPHGQVRTYASIASDIGQPRAMRAVGMANGANPIPIVVPCHRVIEKNSLLGGFSSGLHRKRILLKHEGCVIQGDVVQPGQLGLF